MIEVSHLTKLYGSHRAVSDLSFSIEQGKIYGFLGPNGAGKTTTMNIMTGCLAATQGTVTIGGYDIFDRPMEAKALMGYLPEQPPLYLDMTPREYLTFVANAKGLNGSKAAKDVDQALEVTQTGQVRDRLIRNLSKGYRQRVGIAQALLGSPKAVILDEPTVGLDPIQIIEIRELISQLGEEHTVILSSHILSEVRAVCGHIMIISKGSLVASDTPENLERLFSGTATLELSVLGHPEDIEQVLSPLPCVGSISFSHSEIDGAQGVSLESLSGEETTQQVFYALAQARMPILRMDMRRVSLEDVFIELTSQNESPLSNDDGSLQEDVHEGQIEEDSTDGNGGEDK